MQAEDWDMLSGWLSAWTSADDAERDRLRARLAADRPDLVGAAVALSRATDHPPGFLETPAFLLAAQALASDVDADLVPADSQLGPYQIAGPLARGGMGIVYRATDVRLQRQVALKVLSRTNSSDPERMRRFLHEAQMTAALDHPNVVRVYDVGLQGDRAFLVTELLEGETLRARISRGALPLPDAIRVARDVVSGLAAAHAAGLVHRDLKPENIFLTHSGATKILDFGIAKLAQDETVRAGTSTLPGVVLGTAGYLAPEQIRGDQVDPRADFFALGAVLFEMLTGRRAFERDHVVETLHAILHDQPPAAHAGRPDVPPTLSDIVRRLLAKSPDARFQSTAEVASALDRLEQSNVGERWRVHADRLRLRGRFAGIESRARAVPWIVAAVAVVLVSSAALLKYGFAPGTADVTLAVMPFAASPPDSEGMEVGLAEVLISRLSQLADMRVLPLTATARLTDERDPIEAARRLGATHLFFGRLQRDNGFVRATVQLVTTADRRTIWSRPVDTDASSLFAIQDIVVTRIVEEVAPQLPAAARRRLASAGTRSNEAYEAYIRGRAHAAMPTRGELTRAAALFERAVALDASYADAWAALGTAYRMLPLFDGVPSQRFVEAKHAATRALTLQPDHAEAYSVLGTVAFFHAWDYHEAERLLRQAVDLQPSSAQAYLSLAHLLSNIGRHDDALVEVRRARALDPSWPLLRSLEGQFLFMARRYELALSRLTEVVKVEPRLVAGHNMRVFPLIALGRFDEAVAECDEALSLNRIAVEQGGHHSFTLALRGYALARMGRAAEAEQILAGLREQARQAYVPPHHEALLLLALGRDDEALARLRDAVDARDLFVTFVGVDPKWDQVRDVPAFRTLAARANLLEVSDRARR